MAAAAAKPLQSFPTLCNPMDGSQPSSPIPGILHARALEWVAISFSNVWKWKVKVKSLSRAQLLATPWTAAYQAPLSMGFSRQEYWSGVPLPWVSLKWHFSNPKLWLWIEKGHATERLSWCVLQPLPVLSVTRRRERMKNLFLRWHSIRSPCFGHFILLKQSIVDWVAYEPQTFISHDSGGWEV